MWCNSTPCGVPTATQCSVLTSPAQPRWLHRRCSTPVNSSTEGISAIQPHFREAIRIFYGSFKHFLKTNNGFNRNVVVLLIFDRSRALWCDEWAARKGEVEDEESRVKECAVAVQVAPRGSSDCLQRKAKDTKHLSCCCPGRRKTLPPAESQSRTLWFP